MKEKELVFLLLSEGIRNHKENGGGYIEVAQNPGLIEANSTDVEATLEFLAKKEFISDYLPTYGQYGHGFAYKISTILHNLSDDELRSKINTLLGNRDNIVCSLNELIAELNLQDLNTSVKEYLFRTIDELKIAYTSGCFVSCRLICEQLIETALIKFLDDNKTTVNYTGILKNPLFIKYFDQRLTEKGEIIQKSRSIARTKMKFSIPTERQTSMEILKVIDAVKSVTNLGTEVGKFGSTEVELD